MKTLITALILACGIALPATHLAAAPASKTTAQFAKKTYGGFKPGKKFSFKVTEVVATKQKLGGGPTKTSIPKGIPKFKKGKKVKFTIGKKGELKMPGYSIKFEADGGTSNAYVNKPKGSAPQGDAAIVFKDSNGKPTTVALTFFKAQGSGFNTTIYQIFYEFK